ncbi:hypothetical protein QR680_003105 [Steinernema hermaphroditum]|uniref:Uncharacterized protein n=1 Tax=Steinernema hermaphroditum TaxID=289476 RepID=A0AA39LJP4_9BILA|nr:hypothetical protein QR680_003105 [Steinernema hermaphroditum]
MFARVFLFVVVTQIVSYAQQPTIPTIAPLVPNLSATTFRPPVLSPSPSPFQSSNPVQPSNTVSGQGVSNTVSGQGVSNTVSGQGVPNPAQPAQHPMVTAAPLEGNTSPPLTGNISISPISNISLTISPPTVAPPPTLSPLGATTGVFGVTTMSTPSTLTPHRGEGSNADLNATSPLIPIVGVTQASTTPVPLQTTPKGQHTVYPVLAFVLTFLVAFLH